MISEQIAQERIIKKIQMFHSIFSQKDQWKLHSGKWTKLQAKYVFKSSVVLHPKSLDLQGNKSPNLISELKHPEMNCLIILNLKNNKIVSICDLSRMKAPNLRELSLGDNNITNIKQLRKCHIPQLEMLSIYANRIIQIQQLYKTDFKHIKVILKAMLDDDIRIKFNIQFQSTEQM